MDQYFVQAVSAAAQAAIGSSVFVLIFLYAAFELIAAGTGPLVARATGAGEPERRRAILGTNLAGAMALSVLVTTFGVSGAPLVASSLGLSGEAWSECTRTVFWCSAPLNALRVPLAWLFAFPLGWGASGIWPGGS